MNGTWRWKCSSHGGRRVRIWSNFLIRFWEREKVSVTFNNMCCLNAHFILITGVITHRSQLVLPFTVRIRVWHFVWICENICINHSDQLHDWSRRQHCRSSNCIHFSVKIIGKHETITLTTYLYFGQLYIIDVLGIKLSTSISSWNEQSRITSRSKLQHTR